MLITPLASLEDIIQTHAGKQVPEAERDGGSLARQIDGLALTFFFFFYPSKAEGLLINRCFLDAVFCPARRLIHSLGALA